MAKKPPSKSDNTSARSSVTGKYVTDKYAKSHPKTTVVETNKKPGKPGGSPSGTKKSK